MLIRNAEIEGAASDIRLAEGLIAAIAPGLDPLPGEPTIDAAGGALLPGLHDHHVHMQASAAALASIVCGPPQVASAEALAHALHSAAGSGWLRGVGYHPHAVGEIDRDWLDRHGPQCPIRIQHRGGRMWVLNSLAIEALDIDCPADGRLIDRDGELRSALGSQRPDMDPLVQKLLSLGVTGVTDTTPSNYRADLEFLAEQCSPLRLLVMGGRDLHGAEPVGPAQPGPLKLHYHDHDLPPLDRLSDEIADAHRNGRTAAMHCVTRAEIMLALAAFDQAGVMPGDRLEHAAIADGAIAQWAARLGLTIVTQPHFIRERADAYRAEVEPDELPHLWPLRSLADAGIALAAGSDAPFGGIDPWQAMASATRRPQGLGEAEAITPEAALALYTKPLGDAGADPRRVALAEPADLCLIDRNWAAARRDLASVKVRATWIDGELVYDTISSTSPQSSAV